MLRRGRPIQEKREDVVRLRRAKGGDQTSWFDIHFPGATDAVAVGQRIAGNGAAQIAPEVVFGSKDQGACARMHAIGTDQQIRERPKRTSTASANASYKASSRVPCISPRYFPLVIFCTKAISSFAISSPRAF